MNELIEWLRAQFDEDEQVAQALHGSRWYVYEDGQVVEWDGETWADGSARLPNRHQGSWLVLDPARVLRDVAAKRAIVDECAYLTDLQWHLASPAATLRHLASAYADRPGYQEEWRP
jgi:hypothetical protein